MNRTNAISIAPTHNRTTLSKGQKAFNALVRQLEKRRDRLDAWETVTPAFQQKYVNELLPLERTAADLRVRMVHCLDKACGEKEMNLSGRRTIARLITDLAGDLIAEHDDAELKAIYNRHSQSDYDSEAAAGLEDMKSMLEAMLGIELDDDLEMSSAEELLQRAQAQVQQRQAEVAARKQAREERRARRKKSARQNETQAREAGEQAELILSIREVYRKLASALHPDRETDPQERERKTALMQRANQAYNRNNLLQLLELQVELRHIDQDMISNISEDRLKHYNAILKEQLGELDREILDVEVRFRHSYGIPPFVDLSPGTVLRNLAGEIAGFQQRIRAMEEDLRVFDDVGQLKAWLKKLRNRRSALRLDEMLF